MGQEINAVATAVGSIISLRHQVLAWLRTGALLRIGGAVPPGSGQLHLSWQAPSGSAWLATGSWAIRYFWLSSLQILVRFLLKRRQEAVGSSNCEGES